MQLARAQQAAWFLLLLVASFIKALLIFWLPGDTRTALKPNIERPSKTKLVIKSAPLSVEEVRTRVCGS